jgi:carboxyl-terminal processing protease
MKLSMNFKTTFLIPFCVVYLSLSFAQQFPTFQPPSPAPTVSPNEKFKTTLDFINRYYVDTINSNKLVEYAIVGMLKELDPHSSYMSEEETKKMDEPLQGSFEGIGIQFNILNDTIEVIAPISGGPSEKLGILAGDKIVKIDGNDAAGIGITNEDVIKKLRGKKGTEVTVTIFRRSVKKIIDFTIIRDKIPIYSMDAAYMATPEIGYIKLNRFAANTDAEFRDGLSKLKEKGMRHLILDLRGNSGGYLNTAIDLANEFLEENKLIVYTEGINSPKNESFSTFGGQFRVGKLVVLIDRGSASASEIVSGAMQDWDRGLVIGQRSFGKGLVQKPFRLPDGSTLKLTIARYYTPSGRCIQIPYEDGVDKYYKALTERLEKGELFHADSIHFPDSLKFNTLINKRVVYGGGGVMPDIFVPLDTSQNSTYYFELYAKGIFSTFSLEYVDRNRENLKKLYPDFETYHTKFIVDKKMITDFLEYAEKKEVKKDAKGIKTSEELINVHIKMWIARQLWANGEYLQILNALSPEYKKAIQVIQDDTFDKMKIRYGP